MDDVQNAGSREGACEQKLILQKTQLFTKAPVVESEQGSVQNFSVAFWNLEIV